MANGKPVLAAVQTAIDPTTTVNMNGFETKVDFRNREHFRSNGSVRHEIDAINNRLLTHVFGIVVLILVQANVAKSNNDRAWFHAFKQRIGDGAALGQSATARQRFDKMSPLVEHYNSGATTWNLDRPDSDSSAETILVEALMREVVLDENGKRVERDRAHVMKKVTEMTRTNRDKMLNSVRLREIVDAIREERNGGKVDEDKLFEGLDDF